jgi:hypothetical protein
MGFCFPRIPNSGFPYNCPINSIEQKSKTFREIFDSLSSEKKEALLEFLMNKEAEKHYNPETGTCEDSVFAASYPMPEITPIAVPDSCSE